MFSGHTIRILDLSGLLLVIFFVNNLLQVIHVPLSYGLFYCGYKSIFQIAVHISVMYLDRVKHLILNTIAKQKLLATILTNS